MRKLLLSFLATFLAMSLCYSQSVSPATFNVAGGSYDNPSSYYRFEWSFGEMLAISTIKPADSAVIVTQGVLQPCTDKIGNSPMTLLFEKGDYRLFPNPTAGKFEVSFFVRETGRMSLQLVDATGRVLEQRSYQYNGCCRIELFDLTGRPNGLYYVIADLKPDRRRPGDNIEVIRHSGLKVLKMSN
ncbi:hypothetical protein JMG10_26905 [Nostoc ellipsosporum NOK]|nr:hypothetical protein [Nostoc ellipsosporum NOK]